MILLFKNIVAAILLVEQGSGGAGEAGVYIYIASSYYSLLAMRA